MYTVDQLQKEVNTFISEIPFVHPPIELYRPIEYIMALGGKRIRPVLMLLAYNLYKDEIAEALPTAVGVEIFHNYTLMHDDLMDDADVRRGKKTVHQLWNANTAILSGDAMFVLAYQYIARSKSTYLKEVLDLFSTTAMEVCEGQQYDIDFEKRSDVTLNEYFEMIRLKTAVLLAGGLKIGAILGGASAHDADLLYDFGIHTGIAFQLKDDYLDVYGDPATFGKSIGGDILCNKKTYMLLKALEKANNEQKEKLDFWLSAEVHDPQQKIESVIKLYTEIGVKESCEVEMKRYYDRAVRILEQVSVDEYKKEELKELVHSLMYREV